MRLTQEDFISGRYDHVYDLINSFNDSPNEYTPYSPHLLKRADYQKIFKEQAQLKYIVTCWQGNVGANNSTVVIDIADNNAERTKIEKERAKKRLERIVAKTLNWEKTQNQVTKFICKEGNAVLMFNKDGQLIVESIFRFNVYWNDENKIARYAYKYEGAEVDGMQNMRHGVDLFHIKDPESLDLPVAPSRIDAALAFILLENKGVRLNTHLFAKGWFSNILLKLNSDILPRLRDEKRDERGKTWWENFLDKLNNRFSGVEKGGKVGYIPGLEGIFEVGKTNRDSQFMELLTKLTPERIAWAYSMTMSDFGSGENTTYNNAQVFNDALYDKVGRSIEELLDEARNDWALPFIGINTSESFYIRYNEPEDPNKIKEIDGWREDWKNNAITLNEYRETRGLPPIEGGDVVLSAYNQQFAPTLPQSEDEDEEEERDFELKKKFKRKTRTEKLLETEEYAKFQNRWAKAIKKQCDLFLDKFESVKDEDLGSFKVKLDKIESFYAFNVLKKDLLVFAGIALDQLKKVPQIEFKKLFFDGEYPKIILDSITNRTEFVLKGDGTFAGVDEETTKQISNFIAKNASLSVAELTKELAGFFPQLSENRARVIAETEVANASEGTRFTMYKESGAVKKKMRSVGDSNVRSTHKEAQNKGWVPLDFDYGGFKRGGEEVRCRCDTDYLFEDEEED